MKPLRNKSELLCYRLYIYIYIYYIYIYIFIYYIYTYIYIYVYIYIYIYIYVCMYHRSFQSICMTEKGLSDFHLMTLTVTTKDYQKFQSRYI